MRKLIYILAALVAIAVIAVVATQRQESPKTLEGLYDEYQMRGHRRIRLKDAGRARGVP